MAAPPSSLFQEQLALSFSKLGKPCATLSSPFSSSSTLSSHLLSHYHSLSGSALGKSQTRAVTGVSKARVFRAVWLLYFSWNSEEFWQTSPLWGFHFVQQLAKAYLPNLLSVRLLETRILKSLICRGEESNLKAPTTDPSIDDRNQFILS